MKKWLVGSLVGTILLFTWQFVAWAGANLHSKEYKYLSSQDQIMNTLSSFIKEDGQYVLPQAAPGSSAEEVQKHREQINGKPVATIIYTSSYRTDMVTPIIRSFAVDIVMLIIIIFLLTRMTTLSFGSAWMYSLSIGFVAWLWYPYTQNIWFQTPIELVTGALMDWFVGYSLVGLWLGFWLPRAITQRRQA